MKTATPKTDTQKQPKGEYASIDEVIRAKQQRAVKTLKNIDLGKIAQSL